MSNQVTYYLCDPGKNTKCHKQSCKYNNQTQLRDCKMTTEKKFSAFPNEPYYYDETLKVFMRKT